VRTIRCVWSLLVIRETHDGIKEKITVEARKQVLTIEKEYPPQARGAMIGKTER
jgi:hypothetical protein